MMDILNSNWEDYQFIDTPHAQLRMADGELSRADLIYNEVMMDLNSWMETCSNEHSYRLLQFVVSDLKRSHDELVSQVTLTAARLNN